jgi:hypothetical protein
VCCGHSASRVGTLPQHTKRKSAGLLTSVSAPADSSCPSWARTRTLLIQSHSLTFNLSSALLACVLSSKVLCTSPPWLSTAQLGPFPPSWHTSGTQITTAATACMFSSAILAAGTLHIESPNDLVATTPPSRSPISFPSCAHCAAKQRRIPPSERGVPGFARSKAALHAGNIPRSSLAG